MHDPLTVAFEIRRPWPQHADWRTKQAAREGVRWRIGAPYGVLAGRGLYWPCMITVWHRDPSGYDDVTCRGKRWQWHIHHWKIQVSPLQQLCRRMLTRCTWCGGRSVQGDSVNHSHQWDGPRAHWWQGERGLFHMDCSAIKTAHSTCVCVKPLLDEVTYGRCSRCTKHRAYGTTPHRLARARTLAAIPAGHRELPTED